ncbi:hypothetical protein BURPS1710b_1866 [Burkholderia pseudomallei 1710b]|uniref:Uncharacterized protein n=1 Tax=Burkholderia pseudomallei (strain 1710b) TaxID=320372 RepID=Q3JT36_BURP1|nr:hypothetical protein BURPS1710b_1866 [Burkholderia pseudomallei 1710b]
MPFRSRHRAPAGGANGARRPRLAVRSRSLRVRRARGDPRRRARHVAALRAVPQRVIDQHEREHRFGDRRRANPDARVVAAERLDDGGFARPRDRAARRANARRRLDRDRHRDVLPRRDAAEHAARVIADEAVRRQLVAVHRTALRDARETRADLDALHRVDPHHRVRDVGVEPVEQRLAPADRHARRDDIDARADRIAVLAQRVHVALELRHDVGVRREERVLAHVRPVDERDLDFAERAHVAAHLDAEALAQPLLRDRAGADDGRRQPRGRAAAAAIVAHAVLLPVGVIGMARAERLGDVAVVLAALVGVADQERDRRAGRHALEHAGQDLDLVGLLTLRDVARRAGLAAVELELDVGFRERHARRAAVDHAADRGAVRFAEGRDSEKRAEGVAGHRAVQKKVSRGNRHYASPFRAMRRYGARSGGAARPCAAEHARGAAAGIARGLRPRRPKRRTHEPIGAAAARLRTSRVMRRPLPRDRCPRAPPAAIRRSRYRRAPRRTNLGGTAPRAACLPAPPTCARRAARRRRPATPPASPPRPGSARRPQASGGSSRRASPGAASARPRAAKTRCPIVRATPSARRARARASGSR